MNLWLELDNWPAQLVRVQHWGGGGRQVRILPGRLVAFFAAVPGGSNKMYINLYILDNYIHLQNLSTIVQS